MMLKTEDNWNPNACCCPELPNFYRCLRAIARQRGLEQKLDQCVRHMLKTIRKKSLVLQNNELKMFLHQHSESPSLAAILRLIAHAEQDDLFAIFAAAVLLHLFHYAMFSIRDYYLLEIKTGAWI